MPPEIKLGVKAPLPTFTDAYREHFDWVTDEQANIVGKTCLTGCTDRQGEGLVLSAENLYEQHPEKVDRLLGQAAKIAKKTGETDPVEAIHLAWDANILRVNERVQYVQPDGSTSAKPPESKKKYG